MPSKQQPTVYIVILNTNRRDDTLACLASLAESSYEQYRIIVLDNQSTDGSSAAIAASYPAVEIVHLGQNLGYAGNNNVGIAAALEKGADWVLVLNEDTILAPDCLTRLVAAGESDDRVGIVGPMVYHYSEPEMIQSAGGILGARWNSIHLGADQHDTGQFSEIREVEWISGCAIMFRAAAIAEVGMIDERYFYYWEETEWCIRTGKAGWRILHVPAAKLWHKGVTPNHQPKPSVTYYATRNRLLTLSKHQAPLLVKLHVWKDILRTLSSWTIKPRWRPMLPHRDAMFRAIKDFLRRRWGQMPA